MSERLTLVVCAYQMARELPRTIFTLSRAYQRAAQDLDYEIVVIDNGSSPPVDLAGLRAIASNVSVRRFDGADASPVSAINATVAQSRGDVIGLMIDGARMASPGLLAAQAKARAAEPDGLIGTLGFHLGQDVQMRSVAAGYDQAAEDALLDSVAWQDDGYRLFDVSVLAGSSVRGWYGAIGESNAVFLTRTLWERLGGFDERFRTPGGGLANLDFWERAVRIAPPLILLGEATFHQVHGGAATNGTAGDRRAMRDEYEAIRGRPYVFPNYTPVCVAPLGPPHPAAKVPPAPPRNG